MEADSGNEGLGGPTTISHQLKWLLLPKSNLWPLVKHLLHPHVGLGSCSRNLIQDDRGGGGGGGGDSKDPNSIDDDNNNRFVFWSYPEWPTLDGRSSLNGYLETRLNLFFFSKQAFKSSGVDGMDIKVV